MKLLSGKNASPAQELKLECAGCHFPLRNFSFCFYIQCRGFAFSTFDSGTCGAEWIFLFASKMQKGRPESMPPGCMSSDGMPDVMPRGEYTNGVLRGSAPKQSFGKGEVLGEGKPFDLTKGFPSPK